ncbi:MAG TPA: AarF/ABC1/UbiB kinase family protein [Planctomycetota bacterium]|nr:AarF/ABC1/UbiB kinase family protein [Planctomycetota bacterium]
MLLTSLSSYQRDGKRLAQIVAVLVRYGLAERLERIEPDFLKRWLHHEDVKELAGLPLGERVRRACEELGPTFIKIGQILSTRPDVVSLEVARELESLQSGTPASPVEGVIEILEEDLGAPMEELFAEFERVPLASASIGQVHLATLHDGTPVVVKVQHPGIAAKVRVDLNILVHLARFLEEHDTELRDFGPLALAEEAKRTVLGELDFRRELRNQQAFERNFADNPQVRIPATFPELSGPRVLTMEWVDGYSVREQDRLVADGFDPKQLAWVGAHAFLTMVFEDRLFHADPHPGNVFVQSNGRLALLDFGMVGRLDEELLDQLVDLMIGFVGSDAQALAHTVQRMSLMPAGVHQAELRRDLAELQAETANTPFDQLDMVELLDRFTNLVRTHHIRLPPTISLLIKVLIMLDGTSRSLDRSFSLMELLRPYCERAIKKRHSPREQIRRAFETGRDWTRFLGRLPGTLDDIAERLQNQNMRIDLQHQGLEATVDRLVSGILCAAMLLGGSILWALKAPPTIFGISVLGFVGTGLALVHGVRLLLQLGKR